MKLRKEEILRKLLHLIALAMPAGIYFIPEIFGFSKWFPSIVLGVLLLISFLIEVLRRKIDIVQKFVMKFFGSMMRAKETSSVTGSTYIIASGFICSAVFVNRPEISFIALSTFILGDAAAALIGIEFGRIRIRGKSVEGFLGCFFSVFIMVYYLFPYLPEIMYNFGGHFDFLIALQFSFLVSFLEFNSIKIAGFDINDNLYVPVLCGLAISFI